MAEAIMFRLNGIGQFSGPMRGNDGQIQKSFYDLVCADQVMRFHEVLAQIFGGGFG